MTNFTNKKAREFMDTKEERLEYRGKSLILKYRDRGFIPAYWTGYISISESTADLVEGDYMHPIFDKIKVHGGITYLGEDRESSKSFIGFDTAHVGDMENPKSKEFVLHECQRVADQLIGLGL